MQQYGSTDPLGAAGAGDGSAPLERGAVTDILRWHARAAGIPEPELISGHSLRAGMATELYERRTPDSAIAELGRWAQGSSARRVYERRANMIKNNPLKNVDL
jgi:integrase